MQKFRVTRCASRLAICRKVAERHGGTITARSSPGQGATFTQMKVLYMSGYTNDAVVRHGVLDSTIQFIQKPITPLLLAEKVRAVLDSAGCGLPSSGVMPTAAAAAVIT